MLTTPLCDRLGIDLPIVQAPVGSVVTPELAAAVSNAGGLGMLALTWMSPARAVEQIRKVRSLTDRPFGINLVLDFPVDPILAACLGEGVPVVSTFWGDPGAASSMIHAAGASTCTPSDRRGRPPRPCARVRTWWSPRAGRRAGTSEGR